MKNIITSILIAIVCGAECCFASNSYIRNNEELPLSESIIAADTIIKKPNILKRVGKGIVSFINEFSTYDTAYIEPQHYKFQVMWQTVSRFESYTFHTPDGMSLRLSPDVNTTMGPYAGYSLIFLGYTLQLNNLYIGNNKKAFNLSLYTSLFGADIFVRDDNNFKIKSLVVDSDKGRIELPGLKDIEFTGCHIDCWGFNLYYIFNHRHHSYPATYNQSTCQKKSSGAPIAGIGYAKNSMDMDWEQLGKDAQKYYPGYKPDESTRNLFDGSIMSTYSLYGGYSYNWVFAPNWTLGASALVGVSYHRSSNKTTKDEQSVETTYFRNFSCDQIGRMGIVWNNTRFFAGASTQLYLYNYQRERVRLQNLFGQFNLYFGLNFGKKKPYRTPGKFFEF